MGSLKPRSDNRKAKLKHSVPYRRLPFGKPLTLETNEHLRKLGLTVTAFLCIPAHQSRLGDNVTLHCGVDDVTFRFWRQTYARVERV